MHASELPADRRLLDRENHARCMTAKGSQITLQAKMLDVSRLRGHGGGRL